VVTDRKTGPKETSSTVLTPEEEAVVVAFRRYTLLPLDDCLYGLQPKIPHLTRSSLHRCFQRHGIERLPDVEGNKTPKKKFKAYPIGYFHIDIAEVRTAEGKLFRCHAFEIGCANHNIDHRLTKIKHPWTNGQVERMNRTVKQATVHRYYYDTHDQL
jgi:hypothetical protein